MPSAGSTPGARTNCADAFGNVIAGGSGDDVVSGREGFDRLSGGDGNDFLSPSPAPSLVIPFGAVPDNQPDLMDCGEIGVSDGDPGDKAFRVLVDKDVTDDCATEIKQ